MEKYEFVYRTHPGSDAESQYHSQPRQYNKHHSKTRLSDLPGEQGKKTSFCYQNLQNPSRSTK